jgi:drug/metabolite transporter (DMT)-like permease
MLLLIAAIVLRVLTNPIINVFQKQLTSSQHPLFVNLVSYGMLSLASLFLIYDFPIQTISNSFWLYSLLGGILGALGNGFIIKALENGQLSVLGPINAYKSVIGVVFAYFLIGELPNIWGFIGVAFIILGSYFVLENDTGKFSWSIFKQRSIQYRIAALVLTGVQAVTDKQVILHSNLRYAFAGWCIFGFIFSIPLFLNSKVGFKNQIQQISKLVMLKYAGLVISIGIMVAATNYTFMQMQVGAALALFQISILLSVFFGHHFFKEKGLVKKIAGSIIMVAGSLLIIFLNQ